MIAYTFKLCLYDHHELLGSIPEKRKHPLIVFFEYIFLTPSHRTLLNLFRMDLFGADQGWEGQKCSLSLISVEQILYWWYLPVVHYLKRSKKYTIHVTHLLSSPIFHKKSINFASSTNTDIDWILVQFFHLFNLIFIIKVSFDKHFYNFDIYYIIVFTHEVTD